MDSDVELCYGVFFFKQKTAYEMRISDWSSDVCSSDLHVIGIGEAAYRLAGEGSRERIPPHAAVLAGRSGVLCAEARRIEVGSLTVRTAEAVERLQIGRASCRERVCQFV